MSTILFDFITNATRKASRSLLRDFFELEMLQSTKAASLDRFVMQSMQRGMQLVHEELSRNQDLRVVETLPAELTGEKPICHAAILDGFRNLKRGLPFFAIVITLYDRFTGQPKFALAAFPALGEIYSAQSGGGVFAEKFRDLSVSSKSQRLRASQAEKSNWIISLGHNLSDEDAAYLQNIEELSSSQERNFGSDIYSAVSIAHGKLDALYSYITDPLMPVFKLFCLESGGKYTELNQKFVRFSNQ